MNTSIAVVVIVTAQGLLGVAVVTVAVTIPLQQQAEAAGCPVSTPGFNASEQQCFNPLL